MFHTGFTVLGANQDGGKGIGLDCGRPIHLDTLARDFPRMKIIAAHPGWPWQEELIGVVTHKKNVYVDTSGYLAEQLPELFQRAIRGRLQDKALFGTDFPYVDLHHHGCCAYRSGDHSGPGHVVLLGDDPHLAGQCCRTLGLRATSLSRGGTGTRRRPDGSPGSRGSPTGSGCPEWPSYPAAGLSRCPRSASQPFATPGGSSRRDR